MQGSTQRNIPAREYLQCRDSEADLLRYWQRRIKTLPVRTNTPRLKTTVYQRHVNAVANFPTSYDLRSSLTDEERRAVDQFVRDSPNPDTDKIATYMMAIVTPPKAPDSPIKYICYSRADNPLMMLYGAVIASIRAFDRTPDVLFISASQEAALATETERVTGRKYDGRFYTFDTRAAVGNLKSYPVLTEDEMPDQLMHELKGQIAHDTVVVAIER